MNEKRKLTRRQRERLAFRAVIALAVVLLTVLTASFVTGLVRKIRWNDMLMDLAYSTAWVGDEGALYAEHGDAQVSVCFGNARRVQNFLQNGGMGKLRLIPPKEGDSIYLDYGNGTTMTIVDVGSDAAYLFYESPRMELKTSLGYMTQFSKLSVLVSLDGGSEANAPWE